MFLYGRVLGGEILLEGSYQDILAIVFQSDKMAQLLCNGISNTKLLKGVNYMKFAHKVKDVESVI